MIYEGSSLGAIYQGTTIKGFSSGSIVVDYVLHLADNNTEETAVNTTTLGEVFVESYMEAAASGMVDIDVDTQSIVIIGEYLTGFSDV